jgi:hypothetical protein
MKIKNGGGESAVGAVEMIGGVGLAGDDLLVGGQVEDVHTAAHLAQHALVLRALALPHRHEGPVALVERHLVVLEQVVHRLYGDAPHRIAVSVLLGTAAVVAVVYFRTASLE